MLDATKFLRGAAEEQEISHPYIHLEDPEDKELRLARPHAATSTMVWSLVGANVVVSLAMVVLSTYIAQEFHYPVALSLLHQATCWTATRWMVSRGSMILPRIPTYDRFAVALLYMSGYVLTNMSLRWNSVSVFQLTTLACFPLILVLQRKLYGVPWPSVSIALALLCVMVGVGLATASSFTVQPGGLLIATGAVAATAIAQVSLEHHSSFKSLSGRQSMALIAPAGTMLLLALFLVLEVPSMVAQSHSLRTVSPSTSLAIACSCLLSVVYFGTANAVIHCTSAVTYNILAQYKSILILFSGYAISKSMPSEGIMAIKVSGLGVLLIGVLLYVWLQGRHQALLKSDQLCVSISSSIENTANGADSCCTVGRFLQQ
jgi:hypothetical protein